MSSTSEGPISGLAVIDVSTLFAGGLISTFLGDFGARVIKVEDPRGGDHLRRLGDKKNNIPLMWKLISRNKKSITLNLSHPKGQEILKKLIRNADILIENFRPGTMERWNLGYEALHEINPRLIMIRVTAFGQYGPYKDRPGFGTLIEAMSGFAHVTGPKDGPPTLPPFALGDGIAALAGAFLAMAAIYHRDVAKTNEGQFIDLALYEPLLTLMSSSIIEYDQLGIIPTRMGNRTPHGAPRNTYKTKEGKWVAVSGSSQSTAERVLKAIGRADLLSDPRFKDNASRLANVEELDRIIGDWMASHSLSEVIRIFQEFEAPVAPVYDISQIFTDKHFLARKTIIHVDDPELGSVAMPNLLGTLSRTPGRIRSAGPRLGENNKEIYNQYLGLSEDELLRLKNDGVI